MLTPITTPGGRSIIKKYEAAEISIRSEKNITFCVPHVLKDNPYYYKGTTHLRMNIDVERVRHRRRKEVKEEKEIDLYKIVENFTLTGSIRFIYRLNEVN